MPVLSGSFLRLDFTDARFLGANETSPTPILRTRDARRTALPHCKDRSCDTVRLCQRTDEWPGRAFSRGCPTGVPGWQHLCAILSSPGSNYRLQVGGPREDVLCFAVNAMLERGHSGPLTPGRCGPVGELAAATRVSAPTVKVAVHIPSMSRR